MEEIGKFELETLQVYFPCSMELQEELIKNKYRVPIETPIPIIYGNFKGYDPGYESEGVKKAAIIHPSRYGTTLEELGWDDNDKFFSLPKEKGTYLKIDLEETKDKKLLHFTVEFTDEKPNYHLEKISYRASQPRIWSNWVMFYIEYEDLEVLLEKLMKKVDLPSKYCELPYYIKHEVQQNGLEDTYYICSNKYNYDRRFGIQIEWSIFICLVLRCQMKIDQWSACNTPKVGRSDNMVSNPDSGKGNIGNKNFDKGISNSFDKLKEQKAKIILSREHAIRKVNNNIYLVQSQTGYGWYKVQWNGKEWACNCPDYVKNSHISPCKHLTALTLKYESGFHETFEETSQIEKKTYSQDWKLYNMAQVQEFELFDQFLYQLVSNVEEPEKPPRCGRPELKLQDQIFCGIMKVYSQLSYKVEIQKTRNSKDGTNTRSYSVDYFDILAVCMFNQTKKWDYRFIKSSELDTVKNNLNLLKVMNRVPINLQDPWKKEITDLF